MEPEQNTNSEPKKGINWFMWLFFLMILVCAFLTWKVISFKKQIEIVTVEKENVSSEKDQMIAKLENLQQEYDRLSEENTQLSEMFDKEKEHVEQLLNQIRKTDGSLANYKAKVTSLESRLKEYEDQIEELKSKNLELVAENFNIKTKLDSAVIENQDLTDENSDLTDQVNKGSVLSTYDINAGGIILKSSGKELPTKKSKRADKIRVSFTIGENAIAGGGPKAIFIRIAEPNGNILCLGEGDDYAFDFEGNKLQYSVKEQINYNNKATDICVYWTKGKEFSEGTYYVDIFADGNAIGSTTFLFEK